MANFAQINENNIVTQVIVVNNNAIDSSNEESSGVAFCQSLFGGNWKQTSYNKNIRKNFAGIGFYYDETRDAFIPPKELDSWILNEDTCQWIPPIPYPEDGLKYRWNEETISWDLVE
jgi:hypothetical protein